MASDDEKWDDLELSLSVEISNIDAPVDLKKDTNLTCSISISTQHGQWKLDRTIKEFEIFHANLVINDNYRGITIPKLPNRKIGTFQGTIEEYILLKRHEYSQYLDSILRRSIFIGANAVQDFVQPPASIRRIATQICQMEMVPHRAGQMKKEGEKFKAYRNRYFVLLPCYILQYYESKEAYQIGISPKGAIDLTLAKKVLIYDNDTLAHSFGIQTPLRTWKLQCSSDDIRTEWVEAIKALLESDKYNGWLPKHESGESMQNDLNSVSFEHSQIDPDEEGRVEELQSELRELEQQQKRERRDKNGGEMAEFRSQMELMKTELIELEKKREATDAQYETKIQSLETRNAELETTNNTQSAELMLKNEIIDSQKIDLQKHTDEIESLQKEIAEFKEETLCVDDSLYKYTGDSIAKLKLRKQPISKKVWFISRSNTLIWADDNMDNLKSMMVTGLVLENKEISETVKYSDSWFLLRGSERIALFASDKMEVKQKWIKFIQTSLSLHNK